MHDMSFQERLTKARSALGMNQTQLGSICGIAATQISRYESARATPRPETVSKIAKALGVSYDWLMTGHGSVGAGDNAPSPAPPRYDLFEVDLPPELNEYVQARAIEHGLTPEMEILSLLRAAYEADNAPIPHGLDGLAEKVADILERRQGETRPGTRRKGSKG